jgi:aryl-alcohol dehydrogenase-like predicted oxidoreductase
MSFLRRADENNLPRPVSIQNPYNLLNRSYEVGLAEISMRESIGLLAYSPLAFGMLTGKFHDGSDVTQARLTLFPKFSRYSAPVVHDVAGQYVDIARRYGLSPTQMALAYVNSRPFLWSNIIGATNIDQLRENIESVNITLGPDILKEIGEVHKINSNPAP